MAIGGSTTSGPAGDAGPGRDPGLPRASRRASRNTARAGRNYRRASMPPPSTGAIVATRIWLTVLTLGILFFLLGLIGILTTTPVDGDGVDGAIVIEFILGVFWVQAFVAARRQRVNRRIGRRQAQRPWLRTGLADAFPPVGYPRTNYQRTRPSFDPPVLPPAEPLAPESAVTRVILDLERAEQSLGNGLYLLDQAAATGEPSKERVAELRMTGIHACVRLRDAAEHIGHGAFSLPGSRTAELKEGVRCYARLAQTIEDHLAGRVGLDRVDAAADRLSAWTVRPRRGDRR